MNEKFERLAEELFFKGSSNMDETLKKFGLKLKPNNSFGDIKKAMGTGLMNGSGKFELEMECCAIEFEKILCTNEVAND